MVGAGSSTRTVEQGTDFSDPRPLLRAALRPDLQGAPLRRPAVIVEAHRLRPQLLARRDQQPRQNAHPVEQQPAVRRLEYVWLDRRAVDVDLIPRLDLLVARRAQQAPVDPLPGLGADRTARRLQCRLAGGRPASTHAKRRADACAVPRQPACYVVRQRGDQLTSGVGTPTGATPIRG